MSSAISGVKKSDPMCTFGALKKPTSAPNASRRQRVSGAVRGSVSMTNAKKKIGEDSSVSRKAIPHSAGSVVAATVTRYAPTNAATNPRRRILRITRKPPTRTADNSAALPPIHHVAG